MENDLLQLIIEMQLQKYARMSPSPEREDLLKLVRENLEDLESRTGEMASTLSLRGRVQMATGQSVDAIQTLSRARVQADQNNPGGADNNLLIMLVQAYMQTQQTGQARRLLQEVIDRTPDLIPARVMYTQLLLQANDRDAAKAQIAMLEKQSPDLPELNRLKLALLDPKKDTKQIDTLVGQLGEEDRSQRLAKAQAAMALQRPTEAQRLLDLILASDPADTEAAELLAKIYLASGDRTSAERVLTEALAKQPGQPRLTILLEAARGASPAQLAQTRRELIEKTTDEFTREMQLFDLERDANDLDKAMGHLRRAREIKPDDAQATDLMFQTLLARREFTEAEKLLPALTTANRDQANGLLYAIKLEQVRGDTGKAIELARELTRRLPEFAVSHFTLGQSLQQAGAFEDALSKYAVALEKRPNDIEAIRASVRCFYGLNRPDEAKRYIEQGLKLQPNDEQLRDMLVKHYLNYRESEKAIPMLQDAAQKNPSNPGTLKGLSVAYFRAAREKAITGDSVTAERYIKLARDTLNAGVATWPDDREFYTYLADIQLNSNDAAGGEKTLLALSNRPAWTQRPEPRLMLAEFYAKANRLDDAEKSMREALEISSNSVDVQLPLANFLAQRGKSDESLKLLESANTGDPRVERQRIETLINFGKGDEAEKSIDAALSRLGASTRPAATVTADRVELLALSGLSAMNQQKFDVALQRLDTALAFDSDNARALFWRGLTRLRQSKPDVNAALVDLQAARDATPDNVEVRLTLADAYNAAGDPDGSTRELETALNLSPLNKIARLRLIGMYSASKPPRWREVEQLLVEASQVPQFSRDADWPNAESSMWMVRGDFDKAMKANQAAQQLSPGNPSIIGNYLQILLASRNYDVLIRETDKIMKENGDVWWLRLARAQAKRAKEDKPGAMDELVAALTAADAQKDEAAQTRVIQSIAQLVGIDDAISQISPRAGTDARWLIPLAVLYQSKADFASARTSADQIMARLDQFEAPRKPAALRTAGMIYLTNQPTARVDEAADAYDRLLAIEPEDMTALNNLACLWVETASPQDPKRALNYSRRAYEMLLRRGAFEPMIYDTHGWVLFKNGRVDEAVDILRQVVDRAPFLEAHYHLAEVYLYKSFPEEAQKQLAAAQDLLIQAERDQRPVDPKIKKSVNDAIERTQKALSDKAQALAP